VLALHAQAPVVTQTLVRPEQQRQRHTASDPSNSHSPTRLCPK
jgi:hypothetical protein